MPEYTGSEGFCASRVPYNEKLNLNGICTGTLNNFKGAIDYDSHIMPRIPSQQHNNQLVFLFSDTLFDVYRNYAL